MPSHRLTVVLAPLVSLAALAGAGRAAAQPDPTVLRGLPVCTTEERPEPGEAHTCRPPWPETGVEWSLALDLAFGAAGAAMPLVGTAGLVRAGADVWPWRAIGLGGSWGYLFAGDEARDDDGDGRDDRDTTNLGAHLVGGGPRVRLFTDETDRNVWTLAADGGYAVDFDDLVPDGAFVALGVAREIGAVRDAKDLRVGIGATAIHGLGDAAAMRALLFSLSVDATIGVREPRDIDRHAEPASFRYDFGPELAIASYHLGDNVRSLTMGYLFGLTLGVPVNDWLAPRARIGMQHQPIPERDGITSYTGSAGLELTLDPWSTPVVEGMVGWALAYGATPRAYDDGPFFDVTAGWQLGGCSAALDAGLRYRRGIGEGNERLHALFVMIGAAHRAQSRATAIGRCAPVVDTHVVPLPPAERAPPRRGSREALRSAVRD